MSSWVFGGLCGFLFLAVVLVVVVWVVRAAKREAHVRANGELVVGWIVQANNVLWKPGKGDNAAQVLITFDPDLAEDADRMHELAENLGRLKAGRPANKMERRMAQLVRDETARFSVRTKLPKEFTGGPTVYSTAIMVRRHLLPAGRITVPYVYCFALPGQDGGQLYMTDYPDHHDGMLPRRRRRRD